MQPNQRKRVVSSCIPCYTRKQKCNRQYPCNHCSRRRRPEQCAYNPTHATLPPSPPQAQKDHLNDDEIQTDDSQQDPQTERRSSASSSFPDTVCWGGLKEGREPTSLAEVFGYFEDSKSNTIALVRKLGAHDDETGHNNETVPVPYETAIITQKMFDSMPNRPILDFLVRYFVAEVSWMDQLIYPPWFLSQYQKWWGIDRTSTAYGIEFAVLVLRICSYASQFLPSPTCTIDSIRGVPLADIRKSCDGVADALTHICSQLDTRGSLIRVQHVAFVGLRSLCQGRTNAHWEALSCAVRVAQRIGLHVDITSSFYSPNMDELEKEMRRRTFCNLYVWDSILSKRLDRIPFLPDVLDPDTMPRMHLVLDIDDVPQADAPDLFTERVLEARLANFWRTHVSEKPTEYDPIAAEERYEKFCSQFLPDIPPVFALCPDTYNEWDSRLATLPLQRQMFHMAILESLCHNFRPALFQDTSSIQQLPAYKQILLSSHKRALAVIALSLLEGVSTLHLMMGGSHTRHASLIIPTFEAAVILLCLCSDENFPPKAETTLSGRSTATTMKSSDLFRVGVTDVARDECVQAVRSALSRLQTLADVNHMAEVGARTLSRLLGKIKNMDHTAVNDSTNNNALVIVDTDSIVAIDPALQLSEAWSCLQTPNYAELEFFADNPPTSDMSVFSWF
ncbi:hypothetical protein QBC36DRAFT_335109 [Triangularia setosa]|uniref:Zn(2)-C6 fungal-type domain-containing protein n=1 Tax=Triangularia setosa TaxID=2587417 RepID=A0AAN6W1Q3_9PEZI|nr:hypothetical protein QBC36DRAFT_335109 [Podospora setosa]